MLQNISSPNDIKNLSYRDLEELSCEIRSEILRTVSQNGGHLASNLGFVEATLALHRVFDFSKDSLIFDVGHQCYAHKMLTGRFDKFSTLRQKDGISGFTNRFESKYDTLTAGHSGPSVSAGLGIAKANKLCGKDNFVVSVVGDGSFTNGMIYEALNNCDKSLRFIIVLNDNEMSISSNVGNLSKHFSKLRTSKEYFKIKRRAKRVMKKIPIVGENLLKFSGRVKSALKRALISQDGFFSALGVRVIGPVDGHDLEKLESVFEEAKNLCECTIIHIKTKKGKGYDLAERYPEHYHSVGSFSPDKGVQKSEKPTFSDVFGALLCQRASDDKRLVALTAAMCEGTGLSEFSNRFPDRFFDVGIAEEHEIAFASGLSVGSMKPVCALYSTFSQRVYDQAFHDVALQGLDCVLALDRCGFVSGDGITHQGLFDVSLFSSVPKSVIYSPETYEEMSDCLDKAISYHGLSVLRYPKGSQYDYDREKFFYDKEKDYAFFGDHNAEILIITYGRITYQAYRALKILERNKRVAILKLVKIYPLDKNILMSVANNAKIVYILEEGIKSGGVGEKIASELCGKVSAEVKIRAVDNEYAFCASTEKLFEHFGMDGESVATEINNLLNAGE